MSEGSTTRSTVAVVTGAARGIGRGIALVLGQTGATVYVTDRETRGRRYSQLPGTVEDTAEQVTELRTADTFCPDTRSCTSINAVTGEPDRRYVITKKVTDPAVIAAFAHLVAGDEQLGYVPTDLIPEV